MANVFVNNLRVRQLKVLAAIADHGNMHRAAEMLGMTQSTASKLLKDLEAMLGVPLFIREARGMRPTDLGLEAISFARSTLARIGQFKEDFDAKMEGGHGLLAIGAIMGAAPDLVARAVAELKAERPRLVIRLLGETSDQILDMLEAGTVEVAVGRFSTPRHWQLFDFEPLGEEPLRLVVRSGHPLSTRKTISLEELHQWPWVLQPTGNPTRQLLDSILADRNLGEPTNYVECASIFAILQLLQSSDAIALLPISVVRDHLAANLLSALEDLISARIRGFGIVLRRNEPLSANAEAFIERLRNSVR